jgi:hypothetical protein
MPPVIGAAVSDEAKLHAPTKRAQIDKRRVRTFILLCYSGVMPPGVVALPRLF